MRVPVLLGDGIGPEICAATVQVLERLNQLLGLGFVFETHQIGLASLQSEGTTAPARVLSACAEAEAIILGPISHADYPPRSAGGINVSAELRTDLNLYANIRPSRSREGLAHYGRTYMDLVIVRENTEGFYADRNMRLGSGEFMPTEDLALAVRKISTEASRRVAQAAFELAQRRRKKVTAVHKANVLRVSDGLFLREVRKVAAEFPDVIYEEQLVDSMAALLVRDAQRFDVVVTTNMFGDILSDEAAELSGSLGLAGAINAGDRQCVAQAQHGSAPDLRDRDTANPCGLILSAALLLEWLARHGPGRESFSRAAAALEETVDSLLADPARRTADLGGPLGTQAFARFLSEELERRLARPSRG